MRGRFASAYRAVRAHPGHAGRSTGFLLIPQRKANTMFAFRGEGYRTMQFLVVFQILCGFFGAFVAGRKGRSRLGWWFIGAFLPVFGAILCLMAPDAAAKVGATEQGDGADGIRKQRPRPRRCCGSYIPDCQGCPYFRRPLFEAHREADGKGTCTFYGKQLREEADADNSRITIDNG